MPVTCGYPAPLPYPKLPVLNPSSTLLPAVYYNTRSIHHNSSTTVTMSGLEKALFNLKVCPTPPYNDYRRSPPAVYS
jgi:hypothetical protein